MDQSVAKPGRSAFVLNYQPPMAWDELLGFLSARAIPGVEAVAHGSYRRTVRIAASVGWLSVDHQAERNTLNVHVSPSLDPVVSTVVSRLRRLFDLDARPDVIADHLRRDDALAHLVRDRPGLRVPGAFDGFELGVRAILGQQVSVKGATTLSGRFVDRFGTALDAPDANANVPRARLFPTATAIAAAPIDDIRAIGMPGRRAQTISHFAQAMARADLDLDLQSRKAPAEAVAHLQALPGIGPWTAHYIAMRALGWPDAFPGGDLGLQKALGVTTRAAAETRATAWTPWRSYAAMHLWTSLGQGR